MSRTRNPEMHVVSNILSWLERVPDRKRRVAVLDYIKGQLEADYSTYKHTEDPRQLTIEGAVASRQADMRNGADHQVDPDD